VLDTITSFPIAAAAGEGAAPWVGFLPIVAIFAIFYFIAIAPMRKQQKQRQRAIEALSRGDKVVTKGGLMGEVVSVDDDSLIIKIGEDTKVRVAKWGIEGPAGGAPAPRSRS
jgi:preprotein translocase subunit YajC